MGSTETRSKDEHSGSQTENQTANGKLTGSLTAVSESSCGEGSSSPPLRTWIHTSIQDPLCTEIDLGLMDDLSRVVQQFARWFLMPSQHGRYRMNGIGEQVLRPQDIANPQGSDQ